MRRDMTKLARKASHHEYPEGYVIIEDLERGWCPHCEPWESEVYEVERGYYCKNCDTMFHLEEN